MVPIFYAITNSVCLLHDTVAKCGGCAHGSFGDVHIPLIGEGHLLDDDEIRIYIPPQANKCLDAVITSQYKQWALKCAIYDRANSSRRGYSSSRGRRRI